VVGEPQDLAGARELAERNKYEFQCWVIDKIRGQAYGDKKKGSDTGIDGYLYYMDDSKEVKRAIISVKGGKNIHVDMVRDLGHVIDREKSNIGVLITLENPAKPMESEAIQKGFYKSPSGLNYPRIQILTVEDISNGKRPNLPSIVPTIQVAPTKKTGKQAKML
jgi:site-specific DNA-methyltransferase (adenine-specific)